MESNLNDVVRRSAYFCSKHLYFSPISERLYIQDDFNFFYHLDKIVIVNIFDYDHPRLMYLASCNDLG